MLRKHRLHLYAISALLLVALIMLTGCAAHMTMSRGFKMLNTDVMSDSAMAATSFKVSGQKLCDTLIVVADDATDAAARCNTRTRALLFMGVVGGVASGIAIGVSDADDTRRIWGLGMSGFGTLISGISAFLVGVNDPVNFRIACYDVADAWQTSNKDELAYKTLRTGILNIKKRPEFGRWSKPIIVWP
jgi:hypothetical protein